jgi:hypothetical protein
MTAALARSFPGVEVAAVALDDVVEGTNSRARIALRYAAASGPGPERVFVKRQGRLLHRLALIALRALGSEAQLFQSGIELPLEHAQSYAASFDHLRQTTIVVLEDVTIRGGRPNGVATPLSVAQARSGLEGLARLHAAYWQRPLPAELRFIRPWRLGRAWAPISRANLARGLRRLRSEGAGELVPHGADAGLLERQFRASARLAAMGPQTILHGDPHACNTYALPSASSALPGATAKPPGTTSTPPGATAKPPGTTSTPPRTTSTPPRTTSALPGALVGFYDWQLVRLGNWAHDVGYFLVSSLDIADRRRHERELLQGYLEALGANGGAPPSFQAAWESYRSTPAFGLCTWLHTFAVASFQPDTVCLPTIARFAAAYEDLQTRAAPGLAGLIG